MNRETYIKQNKDRKKVFLDSLYDYLENLTSYEILELKKELNQLLDSKYIKK